VQTARRAGRALGIALPQNESSTDANVAMALRIPAMTIGGGGAGSGQHTTNEAFDTAESWRGTQFALLLTIALAR
jgi:tripeptide aminopeptidase